MADKKGLGGIWVLLWQLSTTQSQIAPPGIEQLQTFIKLTKFRPGQIGPSTKLQTHEKVVLFLLSLTFFPSL